MLSTRLRLALVVLLFLVAANVGWRIWAGWGLVTINVDNASVADVTRSIGKQAGVQVVTNASADAKVTMHVRRVTLVRALEVLTINANASWTVGYFTAPNQTAIRTALATFESGEKLDGWKKFAFGGGGPPMGGGFGGMGGSTDARQDRWEPATSDHLQPYLEQAALAVSAQFWAPADWNPAVAGAPAAGPVTRVMPKLARAASGASAEVFLVTMRGIGGPFAAGGGAPPANGAPPADGGFGGGPNAGPPPAAVREAMEKRMRAGIDKLPADKRVAALAEFEQRKKFFESLAGLSEEERREKIRASIEQSMQSGEMESRMTQFDAMHTAEQRANFFRMVLRHKAEATK